MPIYDYRCRGCGTVKEVLMLRAQDPVICPECGSEAMEKLVSASYRININASVAGTTCCGRSERCEESPCSTGEECRRR